MALLEILLTNAIMKRREEREYRRTHLTPAEWKNKEECLQKTLGVRLNPYSDECYAKCREHQFGKNFEERFNEKIDLAERIGINPENISDDNLVTAQMVEEGLIPAKDISGMEPAIPNANKPQNIVAMNRENNKRFFIWLEDTAHNHGIKQPLMWIPLPVAASRGAIVSCKEADPHRVGKYFWKGTEEYLHD